jgi:hypothetical protein
MRRPSRLQPVLAVAAFVLPAIAHAQTAPWSTSAPQSTPPPPPPQGGTVSNLASVPSFDAHGYLVPRPGTVPITFVGEANEVAISVPAPTFGPLLGPLSYAYVCTTPCTLYLAPGGASLHLGLPTQLQQDISFVVGVNAPRRLIVATPSVGRVLAVLIGYSFGTFFALAGITAFGVAGTTSSAGADPLLLGIGVGASSIGGGRLALAIGQTVTWHTGIVSSAPIAPRARVRWSGVRVALLDGGTGALFGAAWRF